MNGQIQVKSALISVYSKEGIEEIARSLGARGVQIYSTGGTAEFLHEKGIRVIPLESVTSYPSILGGRVKTLHPKVFGGILWRRDRLYDVDDVEKYEIPSFDLVVVDLYPFEKTVGAAAAEEEIIEKIDIGGISLIRAAAKNWAHVMVVPASQYLGELSEILERNRGCTGPDDRRRFAALAFAISSHYDTAIFSYFNRAEQLPLFRHSFSSGRPLRYGENPHQQAFFHGDLETAVMQLHGKELSYNNLVDIDAAIGLMEEFAEPTAAIIKHTNPCGLASRPTLTEAYQAALACDPVSAFGGIIILNGVVSHETAEEINKLFFEILIAEGYENDALERLRSKKNRIILQKKPATFPARQFKTLLNGVLEQDRDLKSESVADFQFVTGKRPSPEEAEALIFANKAVKHLKSNTIALVRDRQLIGCGMGQTSRVDALRQAITKARAFGFDTAGSVMASDAFFPFPDCVEIAHEAGITAVIQPGGSIRDADSVTYCNEHGMSMVLTGIRHFKH